MNLKLVIPICAATALLASCGRTDTQATADDQVSSGIEMVESDPAPAAGATDSVPSTTSTPDTPPMDAAGDTATTPTSPDAPPATPPQE